MYCIRHPEVNMCQIMDFIVSLDYSSQSNVNSYLKGRSLWCLATCSEAIFLPNPESMLLQTKIVEFAIKTLKNEQIRSI